MASVWRGTLDGHLLRKIDRFVDLSGRSGRIWSLYSEVGRPSIDPELMIRMLIVGYCFWRSPERRLCEEVPSIWPIAGFAGWDSTAAFRSIRRSRRTATAAAKAIFAGTCLRPQLRVASRNGSWAAKPGG